MFKLKDIFVSSLFFRAKSNASIFRMPQNHHEGAGEQVDKEQAPMDIDVEAAGLDLQDTLDDEEFASIEDLLDSDEELF